ncbi:MAG TPA: response regulator [Actinomycetes bacterium]|nr:response regulator [Actinomycetes bacterium]
MIQILLVADDPAFRERLRLALERLEATGEEVAFLEAEDGNDALVLAEAERPDLVVVDVGVTPYGGFGLTRDLKADPDLSCPVIVILERFQDEWLGRWCGADALVHQPVDPFALAQVAGQLLDEDQGRATLEGATT